MVQKLIKINGTTWTLKLITAEQMAEEYDKEGEASGLCSPNEKVIYFVAADLEYSIVLHELFHAYCSDLHLTDTNDLGLDDIEEIFAGMFTAKSEKIIRQARRVYKQLLNLME
jgi:hypothetical protein